MMMRCLLATALALLAALSSPGAQAFSDTRAQEIAQCLPGELQTWNDGRDAPSPHGAWLFVYAHAGAPQAFSAAQVLGVLQRAAQAWAPCGLPVQVMDEAQARARPPDPAQGRVRVQWDDAAVRGNFAAANLTQRTLNLSPAMFALLRQRNPAHPALQTLQMSVSHEMGHFLGLVAHSRRCVDVMSYYHDGRGNHCSARVPDAMKSFVEYRSSLPTACDIARCRAVNGLAAAP